MGQFQTPYKNAIDAFKEDINRLKDINSTLKDDTITVKDALNGNIATLNNALHQSKVTMHTEVSGLNTEINRLNTEITRLYAERFTLYESKITLMQEHEKEKHKLLAEAHANLLKMQVQAKESAVAGTPSLPPSLPSFPLLLPGGTSFTHRSGSVTNAEVWQLVKSQKGFRENVPLPPLPPQFRITDADIAAFFPGRYELEPQMYLPILRCLRNYLDTPRTDSRAGAKVWATHSTKSGFRGRRPDFSITVGGVASADPSSVIAPFEVKHGNASDKDKDSCTGT